MKKLSFMFFLMLNKINGICFYVVFNIAIFVKNCVDLIYNLC